jgi:hypothetical protein
MVFFESVIVSPPRLRWQVPAVDLQSTVGALRLADLALWRQGGTRLMAKQRKTAHELKDIVAARLGVGDVLLVVSYARKLVTA